MNSGIFNLMKKVTESSLEPRLQRYATLNGLKVGEGDNEISKEDIIAQIENAEEFLYGQFNGEDWEGNKVKLPLLNFHEALNTSDVSIAFPRVISNVLQEPKEPNLFLQNVIADTMVLPDNAPLYIEFPTVSAMQAYEMAEGQEYTSQTLSFAQHMTSIRIGKIGLSSAVNEEVLNHSMWPIIALNLRMMSAAIDRKVESILFQAMTETARVVFDNDSTVDPQSAYQVSNPTEFRTTGVGTAQTWNGSFSYNDLVKMCGTLLQSKYNASHILMHPLAWPILAKDPFMRANFFHGGQMGAGIWTRMPAYDQQPNMPLGLIYVPYYAIPFNETETFVGAGSGLGAALTSDIYVIDGANSLFLATRGDTQMDQMDNWFRDATQLKARKYAGVSAKDKGKGMCVAKNVRVVDNHEALFTVRTVAS
jgi:hypothetical protein